MWGRDRLTDTPRIPSWSANSTFDGVKNILALSVRKAIPFRLVLKFVAPNDFANSEYILTCCRLLTGQGS
jgi:hypothetical protein